MGIRNTIDWALALAGLRKTGMDVLSEAATYLGQRTVDYAPVDTGFLANHVQVLTLDGGLGFRVVCTAFYAQWVEFGHAVVDKSGAAVDFVPGQFFMTRAFADLKEQWPSIVKRHRLSVSTGGGDHNPEGFLGTTFLA